MLNKKTFDKVQHEQLITLEAFLRNWGIPCTEGHRMNNTFCSSVQVSY